MTLFIITSIKLIFPELICVGVVFIEPPPL